MADDTPLPKGYEALIRAAFDAGVRTGAGYPAVRAIPHGFGDREFNIWRTNWAGRPHIESTFDPHPQIPKASIVCDLLSLVSDEFPRKIGLREVLNWDGSTRREVVEWATSVHLVASDNEDVVIPAMPDVLKVCDSCGSGEPDHVAYVREKGVCVS